MSSATGMLEPTMDSTTFERELRAEGFTAFAEGNLKPSLQRPEHDHEFDAAVLITAGAITLKTAEGTRTYRPGESFRMPKGCRHAESTDEAGCSFFIGRRLYK